MFIDKSMTKKVITIRPDATLTEAKETLEKNNIRHLPVVDADNKLLGIITDRDIRSALPSIFSTECEINTIKEKIHTIRVKDFMTKNPVTISPFNTLEDAILLMQKHKFGAFPVVDENGILKGIISIRDMMRAFINVLNIHEPGTLVGILAEDKLGQMKRIVDCISEEKIPFGSILVARTWEEGKRAVFPYLLTNNVVNVKKKLEKLGFKILNPMDWYLDQLPKV